MLNTFPNEAHIFKKTKSKIINKLKKIITLGKLVKFFIIITEVIFLMHFNL